MCNSHTQFIPDNKKFYKCGLNKTKFILYAYMLSNPKMYTESVKSG